MALVDMDVEVDAVVVLTVRGVRRAFTREQLVEALAHEPERVPATLAEKDAGNSLNSAQLGRALAWLLHDLMANDLSGYGELPARFESLIARYDGVRPKRPSRIGGLLVRIVTESLEKLNLTLMFERCGYFLEHPHKDDEAEVRAFMEKHRKG